MDLDELRVILAIAETGSVLAASERLKLTRSTLRRRLDALEARVGRPLLYRGPAGAVLTEAGQVVARHARAIVQESNALLASARDVGDEARGVLRVALPVGLPPGLLTAMFDGLRAAHPHLAVDVRVAEDPLQSLAEDADLVFHFGARLAGGAYLTRVVRDAHEGLLASPAYLEAHGTPQNPAALVDHDLLVWRRPAEPPDRLPLLDGTTIPITPRLVTPDIHVLRAAVAAGAGIGLLPEGRIPGAMGPEDGLVPVLADVVGRECFARMVVPEPLAQSPKVRRVLEQLAALLPEG